MSLLDYVSNDLHERRRSTDVQVNVEKVQSPGLPGTARHVVRRLGELAPVLYDPVSCNDMDLKLPVYEIHRDPCSDAERNVLLKHNLRYDVTVMRPLMLGEECVKTFGHEHLPCRGRSHQEVFEVIEGEALFLLQRHQGEELVDVTLVSAQRGDRVLIPPNCGHIMINASSSRLVVGNLVSRSCLQTYKRFIERRGGAYFLLKGKRLVRNENYPSLPEVRIVNATPLSFIDKESGLLATFGRHPELFRFLSNQYSSSFVSVVIPTLNEAKSIGKVVSDIPFGWEVILVDLSTDGTGERAKSLRPDVRIIDRGPRELGKGAAIRLGLREANGRIVVMMDGDGSHQASELMTLVSTLEAQNADLVQASRMLQAGASEEMGPHEHSVRYFGNRILTSLINTLFHCSITDSQYGFRALRKEIISKLSLRSDGWDIEAEIVARAAKCGGKIVEVPSVELGRNQGESHLDVLHCALVVARRLLVEIFRR